MYPNDLNREMGYLITVRHRLRTKSGENSLKFHLRDKIAIVWLFATLDILSLFVLTTVVKVTCSTLMPKHGCQDNAYNSEKTVLTVNTA